MTVEALTDRDGMQANTSLEKEEMLRRKSFPPNDGDQYYDVRGSLLTVGLNAHNIHVSIEQVLTWQIH